MANYTDKNYPIVKNRIQKDIQASLECIQKLKFNELNVERNIAYVY